LGFVIPKHIGLRKLKSPIYLDRSENYNFAKKAQKSKEILILNN